MTSFMLNSLCRLRLPLALLAAFCVSAFTFPATAEAARIVTLGGAVTETVYALGAGDEVVARDTSSVFPKEAQALPDVGYFRTIGAEGVLSQNPTLIVAARGTGPESQVAILEKSGITFLHVDSRPSAEAAVEMISQIGNALHREEQAAKVAAALREKIDAVQKRAAAAGRTPKVAFLLGASDSTAQAAGQGTAADALITLAGGQNVFADVQNYKSVSPEALIARDPDIVLYGVNPAAAAHPKPDWLGQTRAGREGRVHALDLGYHLVFGPRLGDAAAEISQLFFPTTEAAASKTAATAASAAKAGTEPGTGGVLRCPVTGRTL